jgi:hypothetical protein
MVDVWLEGDEVPISSIRPTNKDPLVFLDVLLNIKTVIDVCIDRLCGLVVGVPGYKSGGTGTIPGTTRFSEK